jgi:hypothetical protein
MYEMPFALIWVAAAMLLRGPSEAAEARSLPSCSEAIVDRLLSADAGVRCNASTQLRLDREKTILRLMGMASSRDPRLKGEAVFLLGELRAEQAVPLLVEEIEMTEPGVGSPQPFLSFPSASALCKIGEPAIREILMNGLQRPTSDRALKLFAYIMWYHYEPLAEQDVVLVRIQRALDRETATNRKTESGSLALEKQKNLARLLQIYRKITPRQPKDWPHPDWGERKPKRCINLVAT